MNFQKTIIAGRLVHTPELKALPSGMYVANFTLVTNKNWTDKQTGEKKESAEYHNCIAFGKTAETLGQYAEGGQVLLVEGKNQTSSWEDQNGGPKRYKTEVVVDTFQFGQKSQARQERQQQMDPENQEVQSHEPTIKYPDADELDINPDDIPF